MTVKELADKAVRQMGNDIIDALRYTTYALNSDGTISSSGFSEYDDWKKVADEIADAAPCRHEWVNVGFHFDKWVCKKCDVNKGSNE